MHSRLDAESTWKNLPAAAYFGSMPGNRWMMTNRIHWNGFFRIFGFFQSSFKIDFRFKTRPGLVDGSETTQQFFFGRSFGVTKMFRWRFRSKEWGSLVLRMSLVSFEEVDEGRRQLWNILVAAQHRGSIIASRPAAPGSNTGSAEIFNLYCLVCEQCWDWTQLVLSYWFHKWS